MAESDLSSDCIDLHSKWLSLDMLIASSSALTRLEEAKRVDGFGGLTPLLAQIYHGNADIAHWLIDNGSNVNAVDLRDCNALHYAVGTESVEILHRLLSRGANINKQSKAGHTPLHLACQLNRIEAAEELIKKGIDTTIKDSAKRDAFSYLKGSKAAERPKLMKLAASRLRPSTSLKTRTSHVEAGGEITSLSQQSEGNSQEIHQIENISSILDEISTSHVPMKPFAHNEDAAQGHFACGALADCKTQPELSEVQRSRQAGRSTSQHERRLLATQIQQMQQAAQLLQTVIAERDAARAENELLRSQLTELQAMLTLTSIEKQELQMQVDLLNHLCGSK